MIPCQCLPIKLHSISLWALSYQCSLSHCQCCIWHIMYCNWSHDKISTITLHIPDSFPYILLNITVSDKIKSYNWAFNGILPYKIHLFPYWQLASFSSDSVHSACVCVTRRPQLTCEHDQGDQNPGSDHGQVATDYCISWGDMYQPHSSHLLQARYVTW